MKIRVVPLVVLVVCVLAFASTAVVLSASFMQRSVDGSKYQAVGHVLEETGFELVGEEYDTPGIPRPT